MKIKNFLIESAYFPSILIAMWLTVSSCAAHSQDRVSVNVDWLALGNGVWMPLNVQTDTVYAYAQFGWVTDSIVAYAQTRHRTSYNVNQRLVYMRGDTVFQRNSNGVEEPLLPPSAYQYNIDSLEAELYLYKPKPGIILIELDTTSNKMVYRKKIGYVKITSLYNDSLWVTDSIFVTAHRLNDGRVSWENVILTPPLQSLDKQKFGWVTDSIKWVSEDTTFEGEPDCNHDWVYSEPDIVGYNFATYSCLVYHPPGQHCDFYNDVREKICRHCLHSEIEREQWYQRFVAPPKSEFELLKEKQNARHR